MVAVTDAAQVAGTTAAADPMVVEGPTAVADLTVEADLTVADTAIGN